MVPLVAVDTAMATLLLVKALVPMSTVMAPPDASAFTAVPVSEPATVLPVNVLPLTVKPMLAVPMARKLNQVPMNRCCAVARDRAVGDLEIVNVPELLVTWNSNSWLLLIDRVADGGRVRSAGSGSREPRNVDTGLVGNVIIAIAADAYPVQGRIR